MRDWAPPLYPIIPTVDRTRYEDDPPALQFACFALLVLLFVAGCAL